MIEKIKKIVLVTAIFMAVMGMIKFNSVSTYADGEKIIKVHYLRDDSAYSDYVISMWDEYNDGKDYTFTVNGNEAVAEYVCSNSASTVFSFVIKAKNNAAEDIITNRTVDLSEVVSGTVDLYVKAGVNDISQEGFDNITNSEKETTTVLSEEKETTVTEETSVKNEKNATGSKSDKDYSVSVGTVILIDIISILLIAVLSFVACSEKKKKD